MTSNEQFEKWWKVRIQQDYGFPLSYRSAASAVWHARDDEIAQLKRPPMTRELPTVAGDFHYIPEVGTTPGKHYVVMVVFDNSGILIDEECGTPIADHHPGLWSARPIEMDPMPEGGE